MPYHRSPWVSPPLLIILLPIAALTLLFLAVPPLLSATTNVLRPSSVVKKSWDSLNILLVVFAILCGVFARRYDDESPQQDDVVSDSDRNAAFRKEASGVGGSGYGSGQWFGFSEERKGYDATPIRLESPATGVTRLRRSSSSYPDLRNWDTGDYDRYRFRFFDDYEIDKQLRSPARDQVAAEDRRTRWPNDEVVVEEVPLKEIPVDTFETRSSPPRPKPPPMSPPEAITTRSPPPPPPPPPPPAEARRETRRTNRRVDCVSEITEIEDDREFGTIRTPPPAPPTPPHSPPSVPVKTRSEQKHGKSGRRKSNVRRDIATVWASVLSNQRKKKKKQRTKSDHNNSYDDVVDDLTESNTRPPPPPPPPPPSVFHSLFRKGLGKSKKIHSVSAPPPPPPPPPLTSSRRWPKWKSPIPPPPPPPAVDPQLMMRRRNAAKPPLPNRAGSFNDEPVNAGNQSPLIPVPPPLPPFKIPAMKFVVRGDFVKIRSNPSSRCSSRCSSPERDKIDASSITDESETAATVNNAVMDGNGAVGGSVFCPSPDVNVKAATFIARLRGEWKLEKLNSLKEKGGNGALPSRHYDL